MKYEKEKKDRDWEFVCQSFEETIKKAGDNSFIYCDHLILAGMQIIMTVGMKKRKNSFVVFFMNLIPDIQKNV